MKRLAALLLLALPCAAAAQEEGIDQPVLVPNINGHTSLITGVAITPDGRRLVSCSLDKTVRVWDLARGVTTHVLRPPIGKGREGMLQHLALSPDGNTVAVAGHAVGNGRFGFPIYVIDLRSNRIAHVLKGHKNHLWSLAFSPDGKHLASGSLDWTVKVWDAASGTLEKTLEGHKGNIRMLCWSPDSKQIASVSNDKMLRIWDVEAGKSGEPVEAHTPMARFVAWSPDGRTIATSGEDQSIALWEPDGKMRHRFEKLSSNVTTLSFSRDSQNLLFTRGAVEFPDRTSTIINVQTGSVVSKFNQHGDNVFAGTFSPDGSYVATAGSRAHEIFLWRVTDGQLLARLGGGALVVVGAGWSPDGNAVAWSNVTKRPDQALDYSFRPADLEFGGQPDTTYFRSTPERGGLSITLPNINDAQVKMGERVMTTFKHGDRIRSSSFLDGDRVALGSYNLMLYDVVTGQPVRALIGHTAEVIAMAPGPNRRWLATASFDQTLRLWDTQGPTIKDPGGIGLNFNRENDLPVVTLVRPGGPSARDGRIKVKTKLLAAAEIKGEFVDFKGKEMMEVSRYLNGPVGSAVRVKIQRDGEEEPIEVQLVRAAGLLRSEPFLSLFFAGNEWVGWTPEGFYAASPNGERIMGWHVNNGLSELATFHPADRFSRVLYRPDIIRGLTETGSAERAIALADMVSGKKTERLDIASILPPKVKITSPNITELTSGEVEVTAEAQATGKYPIKLMRLLVDGRPFKGTEGTKKFDGSGLKEAKASWTLNLLPGKHRLVVQAESAVSLGDSPIMDLNYAIGTPPQGRLFVLAIGIAEYKEDKLKLSYSAKDAEALAKRLKLNSMPVPFQDIKVKTLTDKEATREAIVKELDALKQEMKPTDSAWVFFSGHGHREPAGGLFLLPVDADLKKLKDTGLSGDDLKNALVNMPGLVLLVLDACHSGEAGKGKLAVASVSDELARELGRDENGVIVMCSSMARQQSVEDNEHKQGTFTFALLEGLAGKGAKGLDGVVYQHHLDSYVIDRVRQLTKGKQTPTTAKPGNLPPFPLAKP